MRRLRSLAAVLALVITAAGCANIPEQSNPQVAGPSDTGELSDTVVPLPQDADPLTVVREFIGHASNPEVAKQYLTADAQRTWEPDPHPTIMDNTFSTYPPVVQEPNSDGTRQTVIIHGNKVGRLAVDSSFFPANGSYDDKVQLQRGSDGQWRISNPPSSTVITINSFRSAYQQVPLYFFDSELSVLVPDLRYVLQQPLAGMPSRVLQLLLAGPSDMLKGPLRSLLGEAANTNTNPVTGTDGDLVVNLTDLGDQPVEIRKKIAAQIVLSLQAVSTGEIRLMSDYAPLVPGHDRWRVSDVPFYAAPTTPNPNAAGMFVSNGRLRSLKDGNAVPGPAGAGAYQVDSAAQSIDGSELAVVERHGSGVQLRVGKVDGPLSVVPLLAGTTMTRPTWQPGKSGGDPGNEVWTVVNNTTIVRVLRTKDGTWAASTVNASALGPFGSITTLRLSRDGTRLAMVAKQHIVVAGVDREPDAVTVKLPRTLLQTQLGDVVGVDWARPDMLVAATSDADKPVVNVPFDGVQEEPYDPSNLGIPLRAVAAAPNRLVIVTDNAGRMWTSAAIGEVWRTQGVSGAADPVPFYPG